LSTLPNSIVGTQIEPDEQQVDARWLMAYNAALGEVSAEPHPLFPVCYEWPATRRLRERAGLAPIDARLVHAQHDLTLHTNVKPGPIRVSGKVVAAVQRKPGTLVVFRFDSRDAQGDLVSTTDFSALYREVKLEGGDRSTERLEDPPLPKSKLESTGKIAVASTAAHVYTECARIFNPIHTDTAYARAAGLPDIILHGTATLALSVSKIIDSLKIPGSAVRRVRCRFAGMVLMPSTLTVYAAQHDGEVAFETRNERGAPVIERGWLA
jgi:acyl dehydratase